MNRTAWLLLGLLVTSNLVWLLLDRRPAPPPPAPPADEARIRELEHALASARERITELTTNAPPTNTERNSVAEAERTARLEEQRREAERRTAELSRQNEARVKAAKLVEDAMQTIDPAVRAQALESIRLALASGSDRDVVAALTALAQLGDLSYERAPFRALVLPYLSSADAKIRAASLYALYNTEPHESDVNLLLPMTGDPSTEVRSKLAHILFMYGKGNLEGEVADAVVTLLDDQDAVVRASSMRSLWGAKVTPEIEDRYLARLDDPRSRHDAIYFGFSTFSPKSPRAVEVLVDAIDDPDPNVAQRALWGLGHGIEGASQAKVADAALRLLESRGNPRTIGECMRLLQRYGSSQHVARLQAFGDRTNLDESLRAEVKALATALASR